MKLPRNIIMHILSVRITVLKTFMLYHFTVRAIISVATTDNALTMVDVTDSL